MGSNTSMPGPQQLTICSRTLVLALPTYTKTTRRIWVLTSLSRPDRIDTSNPLVCLHGLQPLHLWLGISAISLVKCPIIYLCCLSLFLMMAHLPTHYHVGFLVLKLLSQLVSMLLVIFMCRFITHTLISRVWQILSKMPCGDTPPSRLARYSIYACQTNLCTRSVPT